jgi:hypothetical protein
LKGNNRAEAASIDGLEKGIGVGNRFIHGLAPLCDFIIIFYALSLAFRFFTKAWARFNALKIKLKLFTTCTVCAGLQQLPYCCLWALPTMPCFNAIDSSLVALHGRDSIFLAVTRPLLLPFCHARCRYPLHLDR